MGRYATTYFQTQLSLVGADGDLRRWVGRLPFEFAWRRCPRDAWRPKLLQAHGLWDIPAVKAARSAYDEKLTAIGAVTAEQSEADSRLGTELCAAAAAEREAGLKSARATYEAAVQAVEDRFTETIMAIPDKVRATTARILQDDARATAALQKFHADLVKALPSLNNDLWVISPSKTDPRGFNIFEERRNY